MPTRSSDANRNEIQYCKILFFNIKIGMLWSCKVGITDLPKAVRLKIGARILMVYGS